MQSVSQSGFSREKNFLQHHNKKGEGKSPSPNKLPEKQFRK